MKNKLQPIPVMLQNRLVMKQDAEHFTLAPSFSFDEEKFKALCTIPLHDDS